jgi:hypothetical protein
MKKYFYERNNYKDFKSNVLFGDVLKMNNIEFESWSKLLRSEIKEQWDTHMIPPVIGKNEPSIIKHMSKLRENSCEFLEEDTTGDCESLGIIQNFNKDAAVVNQFFPTMLKTKISVGKTAEGGLSIYDYFGLPEMEGKFINIMKRAVKRDGMYNWSRSVINKKSENDFWNGQSGYDFVKQVKDGKIFVGKWDKYGIYLTAAKESTFDNYGTFNDEYVGHGNVYLSVEEVEKLREESYLEDWQITGTVEPDKKYMYAIRYYDVTEKVFPTMLRVIRLSCGQAAVNFPALTAKYLYEHYTEHIEGDGRLNIYDSSAGWGGRIIGAMSSRKKFHYIGTDPNPDNFIDELGITRYEYIAEYYNKHCVDNHSDTLKSFFEVESQANTFELFTNGSENIRELPNFQKYKGFLDMAFTSPPYFNREQYSQDETQSFIAYSEYEDWRDNFLKPTLTTIYQYLKPERFILWNIADIKIGSDTYYSLEEDSKQILMNLGCEYHGKIKMLMTRMVGLDPSKSGVKNAVKHNGKSYKYEPIFVFYKPKEYSWE